MKISRRDLITRSLKGIGALCLIPFLPAPVVAMPVARNTSERIFMGFFKNGDTVPAPVSRVDGYRYSRSEFSYCWSVREIQSKHLYWFASDVDDFTGLVFVTTSYHGEPDQHIKLISHGGILKVYADCKRKGIA